MASIVYGCITPHPPIMLPQIGMGREAEVSATIEAMGRIAGELAEAQAETILIVSPHGVTHREAMGIATSPSSEGTMGSWGAMGVDYRFENDLDFVAALREEAREAGIPLRSIGEGRYELDHGVMVPAYFLRQALKARALVPMSFSNLPLEDHLAFGRAVARAAAKTGKRTAFIASGDLSHRLIPGAPAGYDPLGQEFDRKMGEAVALMDSRAILDMDETLIIRAGECGLRSIVILLGALEGTEVTPEVLAYEGPFGVGYLTASFRERKDGNDAARHPLVQLAKDTVETYVERNSVKKAPAVLTPEMARRAGVFVSIRLDGELRGCVGTSQATQSNVAEEVIWNAIGAAARDDRFSPITRNELPFLKYSVDVLAPLEPIDELSQLDPSTYGLLVRSGARSGLLLPGLKAIMTPEQQLAMCRAKAGLGPEDPVDMHRFRVHRYQDVGLSGGPA